jgi:hypothetical protein
VYKRQPFDALNTVKASVVFADTTLAADLTYEISLGKTAAARSVSTSVVSGPHKAKVTIESYDSTSALVFPFCISTATIDGAVSSDATVDLDGTPTGNFSVGDAVSGTNVDAGQTVASITDTNTFELSSADTIGDGVTLTFNGVTTGSTYTLLSEDDNLQTTSLGSYRTLITRHSGLPFIGVDNVLCSYRLSAGTGKKFRSSFVNSFSTGVGGFNQLNVSPSSHTAFVTVEQSFTNDGSANPITADIVVKFNPPADFDTQVSTIISLGGKFVDGNIIESI